MHKPTLIKVLKMLNHWDPTTHGSLINYVVEKSVSQDDSLDAEKLHRAVGNPRSL